MNEHLLEIDDITLCFGDHLVLEGVSFVLNEGDCVAIIGPNGSGKTTILRSLSGLIQPTKGRIMFTGTDITRYPPWQRARMGLVHVLEGARLFPTLTVKENMAVTINNTSHHQFSNNAVLKSCFPFLNDPSFLKRPAATLSGGERMMVAIAQAIAQTPKLLLFDSPFMGAGPSYRKNVEEIIRKLHLEHNVGIILVDHDIDSIRRVTKTLLSINNRTIIF